MATIAVLALQGAFIEHEKRLQELGCKTIELRKASDLDQHFDGLVLPGGESTVQSKLLHSLDMYDRLRALIEGGLPVLGTCAGLILLAQTVEGAGDLDDRDAEIAQMRESVEGFQTLPVTVERNSYGRQLGSSHEFGTTADGETIPLTFIRAPKIMAVGDGVQVLVQTATKDPVAVRYRDQIACSFHPELNDNLWIYQIWLKTLSNE